ncbi:hypothetical protein [Streptomyces sp. ODS28]|uniref:hypothetical protein n=1 Tax=Streptomyces sp. ODS28 TaxID=3136688 RepID=UPI0031E79FD3
MHGGSPGGHIGVAQGFGAGGSGKPQKVGKVTTFFTYLIVAFLAASGVFGLLQSWLHILWLSCIGVGAVGVGVPFYRWRYRHHYARQQAYEEGAFHEDEDCE